MQLTSALKLINSKSVALLLITLEILSFSFFLLGTFQRNAVIVKNNDLLGLLGYLKICYWVGLFILVFTLITIWLIEVEYAKILTVAAVLLLAFYLLGISAFIQKNASFFVSYYPSGEVQTVLKNSHVDLSREGQLISYHYWPGMHFFSAVNILILGIGLEALLKYVPLLWILVFVLLTYVMAKSIGMSLRQWLVMAWLIVTAQWVGQYYYSAQAFAVLMYVALISILLKNFISWKYGLICILLIGSLIATHSLTSLAVVMGICMMALYKAGSRNLAILSGVLFLVFYLYLSNRVFAFGIHEFLGKILSMEIYEFWKSSEFSGAIKNFSRILTHYARAFYAFSFSLFFVATIWAIYSCRKTWTAEKRALFYNALLWLIGVGALILFRYGTEMQYRVYLYATVIIVVLLILSYPRSKLIIFYAVILTVLHIPAHYGTYSYEQTLDTELAGAKFIAFQVEPKISYSYRFYPYVRYYDPGNLSVRCKVFAPQYDKASQFNEDLRSIPYISDSRQSRNYMLYAYEYDPLVSWINDNGTNLEMVYDNGAFWTYSNRSAINKLKKS